MASDPSKKVDPIKGSATPRELMIYGAACLAVVALLTLPAALLALGANRLTSRVGTIERWVLLVGGMVVLALNPTAVLVAPVVWLFHVLRIVHGPTTPVPWIGIVVMADLYFCALGAARHTTLGGRFTSHIKTTIKSTTAAFEKNSMIPDQGERGRVSTVAPPGGRIGETHLIHALADDVAAIGKRDFSFSLDRNGQPVTINEGEIGMHAMILGATGSGKTVTIQALAASLMDLGWVGMILDLKEDIAPGGLRDFCADYAASHALPFQQMALSDEHSPFWFNPLVGMGPDYIRDTILSLTSFDDAYWQNINKKMLGQMVNLAYDAYMTDPATVPFPTILAIGKLLESGNLNAATKKLRALVAASDNGIDDDRYAALAYPEQDAQKSANGFGAKLTQMYDTVAGRTVLSPGNGRRQIDVTADGLTYIGLDSTGKPDLSILVSSAVLQRMSVLAAQRTTGELSKGNPRFLIIDEASVVNRSILNALLSKARGAGVVVIVCTQGPDDWIDREGDGFAQLTQNVNVAIIMAQGSPKAAEMCAEYIGSAPQYNLSQRVDDGALTAGGSLTERIDFLVQPHEIRQLGIGSAILRVGRPKERVLWMSVLQRSADTNH